MTFNGITLRSNKFSNISHRLHFVHYLSDKKTFFWHLIGSGACITFLGKKIGKASLRLLTRSRVHNNIPLFSSPGGKWDPIFYGDFTLRSGPGSLCVIDEINILSLDNGCTLKCSTEICFSSLASRGQHWSIVYIPCPCFDHSATLQVCHFPPLDPCLTLHGNCRKNKKGPAGPS